MPLKISSLFESRWQGALQRNRGGVPGTIPPKSLKTHAAKMSTFYPSMMSMKTNELHYSFHDVDEKKGS
jgi:hypothetical protein